MTGQPGEARGKNKAMRRITLFFDGHVFDGPPQGTTTFLRGLYGGLQKLEHPFELLVGARSDDLLEREPGLGPEVKLVRYRTGNRWLRLGADIPSLVRKYRVDYAHFQYFCPAIKNCRWIVTVHDLLLNEFPEEFPWSYRLLRNTLFRCSIPRSEIKTTVSHHSRRWIERGFGGPVHVLPNAVDEQFFESYSRAEARERIRAAYGLGRYVLFVSRFEPRKNHELLARAFFDLGLDREGYQLAFVGAGSLPVPALDGFLAKLAPERRAAVRHFEAVGQADLIDFYRAAELFVYPSKAEGFGIPPLEAAALGVPTLCARGTAMADFDFLGDGLFSAGDLRELTRKIVHALQGGLPQRHLDSAREAIRSRYSWENSAKLFASLILADHRSR
jgi:glycosyltransferase involved in cell wall biosynthesis